MPLTKAVSTGGKPEFQVTVVPQANPAQGFQTLGQLASASAELHSPRKNCEPQLSVQRDGDRITHIRVQCNCGQTIELACVYDPAAK